MPKPPASFDHPPQEGPAGARHRAIPVALPGVAYIRVTDLVLVRLLVQEVKHVLDSQGQG